MEVEEVVPIIKTLLDRSLYKASHLSKEYPLIPTKQANIAPVLVPHIISNISKNYNF